MEIKEIGEAREIVNRYLLHKSGNPMDEALMLKELLDLGLTQKEIKEVTGFSQPQISKRLKLLTLIPEIQEQVRQGKIRPSTAYELSKLPPEKQKEILKNKRVTFKLAKEMCRVFKISKEIEELLMEPVDEEPTDLPPIEYKCFMCGEWFLEYETKRCPTCGWLICPRCGQCYCQLGPEGKRVASAMWEEFVKFLEKIKNEPRL